MQPTFSGLSGSGCLLSELLIGGCGLGGLQNLGVKCGWYSVHLPQGHILKAQDKCLERDCCFTKAFIYRSGTPGGWP